MLISYFAFLSSYINAGNIFLLGKSEHSSKRSKRLTSVYMFNITGTCSWWKFRNVISFQSMFNDGFSICLELGTVFATLYIKNTPPTEFKQDNTCPAGVV